MSALNTTTSIDPAAGRIGALKAQAMSASAWALGGYMATRAIRLISNLILTRILLPEHFGIMAIVSLFTTGLQMFSDIGIGPAIIQNRRGDDPVYLDTAWTMQVIRGFILWGVSIALAWPFAMLYDNMEGLIYLIPAAGFGMVIVGFNSTSLVTLNRHLALGKEVVLQFCSKLGALAVMVVIALITRSVWALVIGGLVSAAITMAFSHTLIPGHRNRFRWDREAAQELISFGRWIFISTALTFLAVSSDRLILGKLISESALGVYAIAYLCYDVPRTLIQHMSQKVIFPTMSKVADLPREQFRNKLRRNRRRYLPVMMLGVVSLAAFGDWIIEFLYPDKYIAAGWMLAILAVGLWPRILDQTVSPALLVYQRLKYNPAGSLIRLLLIAILMPIAFWQWGIVGAVVVVALSDVPHYFVFMVGLRRSRLALLGQDLRHTLLFVAVLTALVGGRWALGFGTPVDHATQPILVDDAAAAESEIDHVE